MSPTIYILILIISFLIGSLLTKVAIKVLPKYGFMDRMESHSIHTKTAIRGGGIAIFLTFFIVVFFTVPIDRKVLGLFFGSLIVLIVNFVDDWGKYKVSPKERLFWEIIGIFIVIGSGIGIDNITNPFGGVISFDAFRFETPFFGKGMGIMPLSDLFTIVWVLMMTNIINWIDGIDGLAGGVSAITAITLFALSLLTYVDQPHTATMAIILFGAILGFLPFNFFKGRIKLGDTGATTLGFILAVLAIMNKGKIATFFLILGLPILDAVWVILRRIFIEKRSPFKGDKKHFHHRLLKLGLSPRQSVYFIWSYSALFALIALFLQGADKKLMAIIVMTVIMVLISFFVTYFSRNKPDLD